MSFSHLREDKFKHSFQDTLDAFHNCRLDIKTRAYFFLHCHNFMHQRQTLLESLSQVVHDILRLNENLLTDRCLAIPNLVFRLTLKY